MCFTVVNVLVYVLYSHQSFGTGILQSSVTWYMCSMVFNVLVYVLYSR